jgi:hypothetical protein
LDLYTHVNRQDWVEDGYESWIVRVSIILFSKGDSVSTISALRLFLIKNPTPPPLIPLLFLKISGLKPSIATSSGYLMSQIS